MDHTHGSRLARSEIMAAGQLAEYLQLSSAKIYRMARERLIPPFQVGRAWRFQKELVDEWIRDRSKLEPWS
jgi:excisionase family DNA binding protein